MAHLNDVQIFAQVAEAGGFTAAARRIALPKTTVSRRRPS
jgi:DNA-binding transcriptional LysR family regulator